MHSHTWILISTRTNYIYTSMQARTCMLHTWSSISEICVRYAAGLRALKAIPQTGTSVTPELKQRSSFLAQTVSGWESFLAQTVSGWESFLAQTVSGWESFLAQAVSGWESFLAQAVSGWEPKKNKKGRCLGSKLTHWRKFIPWINKQTRNKDHDEVQQNYTALFWRIS